MTLFQRLSLYEIVLLVLGVLLFATLLVAFFRLVFTGKPFRGLLTFFFIPIVMIGHPSLQSIKIGELEATVNKDSQFDVAISAL